MNIILIILCLILFALAVSYKIIIEQKKLTEKIRRKKTLRYIAIFDATEALLASADRLPYSPTLVMCLYLKMLDTLRLLRNINPTAPAILAKIKDIQLQLQEVQNNPTKFQFTYLHTPKNNKQAIAMLKTVKRLSAIIKDASNKKYLTEKAFSIEDEKLSQIQIKINIENVLKRVANAREKKQLTIAQQLLEKSLDLLAARSDSYSQKEKEHLTTILKEIANENDELEKHFTPRK